LRNYFAEEKQSKTCRTFGYLKYLKYPQGLGHEVFNPLITTIFPLDEGHEDETFEKYKET
jgi:hypothetical protein